MRHLAPLRAPARAVPVALPPLPRGQWEPSPALDPAWLRAHASELDVVHLHFGFEHLTPLAAHTLVRTLRSLRLPLVLTVHDLECPHLVDQAPYAALLDVLVPAADALVTLTPGAAEDVRRRWGGRALVLPHPHVVPLARMERPRPRSADFVVGLHDKRRASNAADLVRPELERAVSGLGGRLVTRPAGWLSDEELWDHLQELDVLVLPYRAGTHSGLLEACADLGTGVVATRVGHLREQQPHTGFDLGVPGSLTAALRRARTARPSTPDPAARAEQRESLARAHEQLYRTAADELGRRGAA